MPLVRYSFFNQLIESPWICNFLCLKLIQSIFIKNEFHVYGKKVIGAENQQRKVKKSSEMAKKGDFISVILQ